MGGVVAVGASDGELGARWWIQCGVCTEMDDGWDTELPYLEECRLNGWVGELMRKAGCAVRGCRVVILTSRAAP